MPWLTPIVFKQSADEPLTRLPRFDDGPADSRFRHLVHVYRDKAVPENTAVQSITFDTIRFARQFAQPDYPVSCVMVAFPEDVDLIPADMVAAPALQRSVTDVARFSVPRVLPLLFDVIRGGMSAPLPTGQRSDAVECLVFTNSDIHLQPPFYRVLATLIRQGYDAITINRRTVDADPGNRAFSPLFMVEPGRDHHGFDCFVFPADMLRSFAVNDSCCGGAGVMRSLLFNLAAHARRFLMLTRPHMTFHLGNDVHWANPRFADYQYFNYHQVLSTIAALARNPEKAKRLSDFIAVHEGPEYRDALPGILSQSKWFQEPASPEKP